MADGRNTQEQLIERMMQSAVTKSVSEQLGSLAREMGEFTKDMSPEDSSRAKLMLIEMMEHATQDFFNKMRTRINKK